MNIYGFLADLILVIHVTFVFFVIISLIAVILGGLLHWQWVRNPWFRGAHLIGIGIVVAQAWAGITCPLTILEMWLRERGGEAIYAGSFIQHWLQQLLYYDAPQWVFTTVYSLFGLGAVLGAFLVPPRFKRTMNDEHRD